MEEDITGASRDHFKKFKEVRSALSISREKELEKILNLFKLLSFAATRGNASGKDRRKTWAPSSKSNSLSGVNSDNIPIVAHLTEEEERQILASTNCPLCKSTFSRFFGKGKKKQCPLCAKIVCSNCFSNQLELEQVSLARRNAPVNVCYNCWKLVTLGKKRKALKEEILKSERNPFFISNNMMRQISTAIQEDTLKFKELLAIIGTVHTKDNDYDITVAKQMAVDLNKLFSNFDAILKKFNALEPPTKREQTLQNNMKLWASQFLQEYLPDFRISHKGLQAIAALPIVEAPPPTVLDSSAKRALKDDRKSKRWSREVSAPVIKTVYPVVLPLQGGKITITGANFSNRTTVTVDHTKCACEYVDSSELIVQAPVLSAGFKSVKVTNPDGSTAVLEQLLLYSTELPVDAASPAATKVAEPAIVESHSEPDYSHFDGTPVIDSINPAISPLRGDIKMTVSYHGERLPHNLILKIDGKVVDYVLLPHRENTLVFQSPSMESEGFKRVELINTHGGTATIDNVLLYTNLLPDATNQPPPSNSSTQITGTTTAAPSVDSTTTTTHPSDAPQLRNNRLRDKPRPTSMRIWGKPNIT